MPTSKKQELLRVSSDHFFRLVAISSSLNLNKILWCINAACALKLVKNSELEQVLAFPVFTDRESLNNLVVTLMPNKQDGAILIKSLANIDFIVEVNGKITEPDFSKIIKAIKKIEGVLAVIEVNPSRIKRKEPFCPE